MNERAGRHIAGMGAAGQVTCLTLVAALGFTGIPGAAVAEATSAGEETSPIVTKSGLVKESGHWRYYKKGGTLLKNSWKKLSGRRYWFDVSGNAATGAKKIAGKRYVFDARGRLLNPKKTKLVRSGTAIFYVNPKGQPAKRGWLLKKNRFYYVRASGRVATNTTVDGIKLTGDGSSEDDSASRLKLATIKRIKKLTNSSMSRHTKLKRCFSWLWQRPFVNSTTPKDIGKRGWAQRCAARVLRTGNIECWGHACTFAMMAYELGCKPRIVGRKHVHAYVMIGNERWDNMAAKPHISGTSTWKVVSWRDTSPKVWGIYAEQAKKAAKKKAKAKKKTGGATGFRKAEGQLRYLKSGEALKGAWLSKGGKTYYFDKRGNAVSGSVKLKRAGKKTCYWVFNASHVLCMGTATRDVKVSGTTYRVRKDGRAYAGWNSARTKLYLANGTLATGTWLISGKLSSFGEDGTYDAAATASLRAACVRNGDPAILLGLLGSPSSVVTTPNSCYGLQRMEGSDVAYRYAHVEVNVFAAEDGNAYLESVVAR